MIPSQAFREIDRSSATYDRDTQPGSGDLPAEVSDLVVERFARLTGQDVVMVPIELPGCQDTEGRHPGPVHPACRPFADTEHCRACWQEHLTELQRRPETHWRRCAHARFCAVAPLVWHRRCLIGCKLVCPGSTGEETFKRHVELLDILVENLVANESALLSRLVPPAGDVAHSRSTPLDADPGTSDTRPSHPQIRRAVEYIEEHVTETDVTVGRISRDLKMSPTYLAHLFSEQVGLRMSRYIATRRIERAKELLATTDWLIKRVAYESGFANADWFSQVFRAHTGLTPGDYRHKMRRV